MNPSSAAPTPNPSNSKHNSIIVNGKERYFEPAPTDMNVEAFRQVVTSRRSVRKFTATPIPQAVMDDCLDLAMLAPCSSGLQPWEFYVVRSHDKKAKLVKACLSQSAAATAAELIVCVARTDRIGDYAQKMLHDWPMQTMPPLVRRYYQLIPYNYAPGPLNSFGMIKKAASRVGGLVTAVPRGPYTNTDLELWAAKSTALACENLVLAFRAHGFDTCMMEGFDAQRVSKLLKLPSSAMPIMVIGAGERADDGVFFPQVRFDRKLFIHEV